MSNTCARRDAIAREAYLHAERRGFAPGHESEDWLAAEAIIDKRVFGDARTARELYGALMTKFFAQEHITDQSGEDLALAFLDFVELHAHRIPPEPQTTSVIDFRNVAILSAGTQLDFLTRRSLLLCDTVLLGHTRMNPHLYRQQNIFEDLTYNVWEDVGHYTNCPDLRELGTWLRSCVELLAAGEVFYLPLIEVRRHRTDFGFGDSSEVVVREDVLYDAMVASRRVVDIAGRPIARSQLVRTIVEVDLPFVDGVNMRDFSRITQDEHDSLEAFRNFFREQFLALLQCEGNESFDAGLQKVSLAMRNGVRALSSDFASLNLRSAFQAAGGAIGTVVATLLAINGQQLGDLPNLLGLGGGVALLAKSGSDYIDRRGKLTESSVYYLWLLSKRKQNEVNG